MVVSARHARYRPGRPGAGRPGAQGDQPGPERPHLHVRVVDRRAGDRGYPFGRFQSGGGVPHHGRGPDECLGARSGRSGRGVVDRSRSGPLGAGHRTEADLRRGRAAFQRLQGIRLHRRAALPGDPDQGAQLRAGDPDTGAERGARIRASLRGKGRAGPSAHRPAAPVYQDIHRPAGGRGCPGRVRDHGAGRQYRPGHPEPGGERRLRPDSHSGQHLRRTALVLLEDDQSGDRLAAGRAPAQRAVDPVGSGGRVLGRYDEDHLLGGGGFVQQSGGPPDGRFQGVLLGRQRGDAHPARGLAGRGTEYRVGPDRRPEQHPQRP